MAAKEYTYTYEEGTLTRTAAYSVTVSENEIITARELLHSVRYVYDGEGTLVKKEFTVGGITHVVTFTNEENRTTAQFTAGASEVCCQSETDHFGRKVSDALQLGDNDLTRAFAYYDGVLPQEHVDSGKEQSAATTQLVSSITFSGGRTIAYEYDAEERITKVTDSVDGVTEYTYDALGQLLTERVNGTLVNRMTYDSYGNILTKNGVRYTYGDSVWRDLLTSYNGQPITYDAGGNPTNYCGHVLSWEKGRQLKSFDNIQYTYNANGIRTSKTVGGVEHTYILDGTKILRETWGENVLVPLYDSEDSVCGIVYNGTPYYFQKNLQGDIIAIVDANAQTVAKYSYDAWGVCTITQDDTACGIATINPYRYRGYYYDVETGLYYLQSRYYDAGIGRFVNADEVICVCIDNSLLCSNVFAYCQNNAVNDEDPTGRFSVRRTWLALGLDIVLTLVAPLFSGPLDILGRSLSWYAKKKSVTLVWDKLLYGIVPKFKGLFSKFFTAIRKAIWRVTGSLIANCTTTYIGSTITRFLNMFKNKTWNKIVDFISCFFSAGSMIAGFLDFIDGSFDGSCRLW